jgi:hypothetical protein
VPVVVAHLSPEVATVHRSVPVVTVNVTSRLPLPKVPACAVVVRLAGMPVKVAVHVPAGALVLVVAGAPLVAAPDVQVPGGALAVTVLAAPV